jgi:hypothetical protein
MVSEPLCCPYCNAHVPLSVPITQGQRVRCPRCQEIIPYRRAGTDLGENAIRVAPLAFSGQAPAELGPAVASPSQQRRSNRTIARLLLTLMGTMAVLGLAFALWTQHIRRQHDYRDQVLDPGPPPIVAVPPAQLPGLGYLPQGTDVILGVHVAEASESPLGRELLARLTLGSGDFGLSGLEQATGLQPAELDHVVLGLKIDERLLPRVTLVVQTRRPYDPEKVLAALKVGRRTERGNRMLYRFPLNQPPVDAALWLADKQTLIFGLTLEDLDAVPLAPSIELERFPSSLRRLLTEQVPANARAWLIGHIERWDQTAAQLLWLAVTKEAREALGGVQTIGLWLSIAADLSFRGTFECADARAAGILHGYLNRHLGKPEELRRMFRIRAKSDLLDRDLASSLRCSQQDKEVTLLAQPSTELLNQIFGLFPNRGESR